MSRFNEADQTLVILQGVRTIALTRGYVTLLDDADHARVATHLWSSGITRKDNGMSYVYAHTNTRSTTIRLHVLLMNPPKGVLVDHKNLDTLDNRRNNLRLATYGGNAANSAPRKGRKFKGVYLCNKGRGPNPWLATIKYNRENRYLGVFPTTEAAARAYDAAALKHFGEFARLNFPDEHNISA